MKDDGGNAFPEALTRGGSGEYWTERLPGMTLRDYFAAKAMEAMLSTGEAESVDADDEDAAEERMEFARGAYAMADAMLEARK